MRSFIIAMPSQATVFSLLFIFGLICFAARTIVMRRCDGEAREELADQAKGLLTGLAATFAFFIGFAITIGWGAVSAAQTAVEQQAATVTQMDWELRNIADASQSGPLRDKLRTFVETAAEQDTGFLARGVTIDLPSAVPLEEFETAVRTYADKQTDSRLADRLSNSASALVASSAAVASVANRALPHALMGLLSLVAILVSIAMGVSTVTYGRRSMVFVAVWCLVPAMSLTVVLAMAYPFAVRSGLPVAPLRAVAQHLMTT